ncbi:hypothetical protein HDU79_002265 [Rhizoclosmatium sp. JEL0117]|nr:hypothetical protein HDU79_002265 [Rhizoclosmatium sp. JEL0117]
MTSAQTPDVKHVQDLKESRFRNKIAWHSAKLDTSAATAALAALPRFAKDRKSQAEQSLALAQSRQNALELAIASEDNQLAKLELGLTNYKRVHTEWVHVLSKMMMAANDLDEMLYSKILHQAVSAFHETVETYFDAANALRQVEYANHIPYSFETYESMYFYSYHVMTNAAMMYRPLIRFGVNPEQKLSNPNERIEFGIESHLSTNARHHLLIAKSAAHDFMIEEICRMHQQLLQKHAILVKASNLLASVRFKIIQSLFESSNISLSESKDVARALEFDNRNMTFASHFTMKLDVGSVTGVKYVGFVPTKKEIGEAVGVLYPEMDLALDVDELPRYE